MKTNSITFRIAEKRDARQIAKLYSIASDGVSDYIWSKISKPGDDLLDIGQQRYERRNTAFSFENCLVAEASDRVVAVLLSYEMKEDDDYVVEDPFLKPFWLLEEPKSLYIAGVAVDPDWRQQGIATQLMTMAESKCQNMKLGKMSLIVFQANTIAYDFYLRLGFTEVMRKPVLPHPLFKFTGNALLLVKSL